MGHLGRLLMHFAKISRIPFVCKCKYIVYWCLGVLYLVFCTQCPVFSVCIQCSLLYVLYSVFYTYQPVLNDLQSEFCTQSSVLSVLQSVFCSQCSVLSVLYSVFCTYTFEQFDLVQRSLSVVGGTLDHLQSTELPLPESFCLTFYKTIKMMDKFLLLYLCIS